METKCKCPELIADLVNIGTVYPNRKSNGTISTYQVEMGFNKLNLYKSLKNSNINTLLNQMESLLNSWSEKYQTYLDNQKDIELSEKVDDLNEENLVLNESYENILKHTINVNDEIDWETLMSRKEFHISLKDLCSESSIDIMKFISVFEKGEPKSVTLTPIPVKVITYEHYYKKQGFFKRLFFKSTIREEYEKQENAYDNAVIEINKENNYRSDEFERIKKRYYDKKEEFLKQQISDNLLIDNLKLNYMSKDKVSVEKYCNMVLQNSIYPKSLKFSWILKYQSSNSTMCIDLNIPSTERFEIIDNYKYSKKDKEIVKKPLSEAKYKKLYNKIFYQVCIRTIHELFESDKAKAIDTIIFNGIVKKMDKAVGVHRDVCIMSILTSKKEFLAINLKHVDASATFTHLGGISGKCLASGEEVIRTDHVKTKAS